MCQDSVEHRDGVVTPWHFVHYGGFAKGGVGAIIVESTGIVPEGRITPKDLGLWNDERRDALKPIVYLRGSADRSLHAARRREDGREVR